MKVSVYCLAILLAALLIASAIFAGDPSPRTDLPARDPRIHTVLDARASQEAQEAVRATLYHPQTAYFRAMSLSRITTADPGTYCGEVNAQNGFGVHTGFQPFSATRRTGQWEVTIIPRTMPAKDRAAVLELHALLCGQTAPEKRT